MIKFEKVEFVSDESGCIKIANHTNKYLTLYMQLTPRHKIKSVMVIAPNEYRMLLKDAFDLKNTFFKLTPNLR